jgi:signal peptidase I
MYNYGVKVNFGKRATVGNRRLEEASLSGFGRVVDIVLDETNPDFSTFGGPLSIGGIRYRPLELGSLENDPSNLPFAYFYETGLKVYPVKGEIVKIVSAPDENIGESVTSGKTYYLPAVNIWNQNNHNAYPDTTQNVGPVNLGNQVIEKTDVQTLAPLPGDIIIEGRTGNSIRLGGYSGRYTPVPKNGSPYIFARVGQGIKPTAADTSTEDINADSTSLYMASNQIIPLRLSTNKRKSYRQPPIDSDRYEGGQFVINSDRVVINGRASDVLISSRESVGASAKSINLDGNDYVGVDAKKIYLGETAKNEQEPAVLGKANEQVFEKIVETLSTIANALQDLSLTPAPAAAVAKLITLGPVVNSYATEIKTLLPSTKSTKVFIDSGR